MLKSTEFTLFWSHRGQLGQFFASNYLEMAFVMSKFTLDLEYSLEKDLLKRAIIQDPMTFAYEFMIQLNSC